MNISGIAKQVSKFTTDNSPALLTAIGVGGVVTTAVLTGKASFKAHDILREEQLRRVDEIIQNTPDGEVLPTENIKVEFKDAVKLTWKQYIPPATVMVLTVAAIVGSNRISSGRAAALAAAYALNQQSWEQFEKKAKEIIGEKEVEKVKSEVAQEVVSQNVGKINDLVFLDETEQLFLDGFSKRPFKAKRNDLESLQNRLNKMMIDGDTVSLSELYDFLGLSHTDMSGELGWNADTLIEFTFHPAAVTEGQYAGKTCFVLGTNKMPFREYRSNH